MRHYCYIHLGEMLGSNLIFDVNVIQAKKRFTACQHDGSIGGGRNA